MQSSDNIELLREIARLHPSDPDIIAYKTVIDSIGIYLLQIYSY
jgi:hypothetical protein